MKKNLPIKKQNTEIVLAKSKNLRNVVNKVLNDKIALDDDSWMQRLWDWADQYSLSEEELPRGEKDLLSMKEIFIVCTNYEYMDYFDEDKGDNVIYEEKDPKENNSLDGITQLPKEIGNLVNVIKFVFGSWNENDYLLREKNYLIRVPQSIGRLVNLEELRLADNKIKELPQGIGNLSKLTTLNLAMNNFKVFPKEIFKLTNLTSLNLEYNQLTTLPSEIGKLTKLTELILGGDIYGSMNNKFQALPTEIGQLLNLKLLNLSGSELTSIPKEIGQLKMLGYLNLEVNNLNSLPVEMKKLTNLHTLCIGKNNLKEVPECICELTNLIGLELQSNNLTELPKNIVNLVNINWLSLTGNPNLTLTSEQKIWLKNLEVEDLEEGKYSQISYDSDLFDRN